MYKLSRILLILSMIAFGCALAEVTLRFGALAILGFVAVWALMRKRIRPVLTAHGTARWAEEDDLRRAGMLDDAPGLIIGRLDSASRNSLASGIAAILNRRLNSFFACRQFLGALNPKWGGRSSLIKLTRSVHTAVFAPTGAGKGVSCVIPFLLDCRESCVVVDFKGDLARITADYRREVLGQRVVILDPFNVVTQSCDTFNPLDFMDRSARTVMDDCRDLANSLVIRTGEEKEPHWVDSAEAWIAGLIATVVEYGDADDRSLQTVRELQVDPQARALAIKALSESDAWKKKLRRLGQDMSDFGGDELGSVKTTVSRFLRFLDTLTIDESTRTSSFDPGELTRGKMTVYLVLPPEHADTQSPLLRMWIDAMLRAVVRGGLQERNKVHFVLDEAAAIGHLNSIDKAVDKYRAYGVRILFILQSVGQVKNNFPKPGQDTTFLSNVNQVFFAVNDMETAEYVSKRLGDETIVVASGGTSSGDSRQYSNQGHSSGRSTNSNDNWALQSRRLFKPEEILVLPERIAISFVSNVRRPVCSTLTRYFENDAGGRGSVLHGGWTLVVAVCFLMLGSLIAATISEIPPPPQQYVGPSINVSSSNSNER
jgi:type IV secretion system protein VirD4